MQKKIYIFSIIIIVIDFVVKIFALNNLDSITLIPDFFYLTLAKNTGAAFSILSNSTWIFIFVAVVVVYFISKYLKSSDINGLQSISYALLLGGIIGNLIDRIIYGYVIDYLSFVFFGYYFPIFNIADICITIGVCLLIIDCVRSEIHENRSRN